VDVTIMSSGQWQPSTHGVAQVLAAEAEGLMPRSVQLAGQEEPHALYTMPAAHFSGHIFSFLQRMWMPFWLQA
jgi:hypothetical protein